MTFAEFKRRIEAKMGNLEASARNEVEYRGVVGNILFQGNPYSTEILMFWAHEGSFVGFLD